MKTIDLNDYPDDISQMLEELIEENEGSRGAVYELFGSQGSRLIEPVLDIVPLLKDHPEELRSLLGKLIGY